MPEPEQDMPGWAIRLEAKVDAYAAQQAQRLETHAADLADHEKRIRDLEQTQPEMAKERLREVENRKTVSPAALWAATASGVTVLAGALAVLDKLTT